VQGNGRVRDGQRRCLLGYRLGAPTDSATAKSAAVERWVADKPTMHVCWTWAEGSQ
jgi:hypothetical protein